jgi:hypothetical protein
MATLSDLISSDVSDVFLDTSDFAESVVHFHPDRAKATVTAIVDRDDMLKPPEGSGASRVIEDLDGERGAQLRTWAKVELAASVEVAFMGTRVDHKHSEFEFADGSRWKAVAPEGSDSAMQAVWCSRIERATTRKV